MEQAQIQGHMKHYVIFAYNKTHMTIMYHNIIFVYNKNQKLRKSHQVPFPSACLMRVGDGKMSAWNYTYISSH